MWRSLYAHLPQTTRSSSPSLAEGGGRNGVIVSLAAMQLRLATWIVSPSSTLRKTQRRNPTAPPGQRKGSHHTPFRSRRSRALRAACSATPDDEKTLGEGFGGVNSLWLSQGVGRGGGGRTRTARHAGEMGRSERLGNEGAGSNCGGGRQGRALPGCLPLNQLGVVNWSRRHRLSMPEP